MKRNVGKVQPFLVNFPASLLGVAAGLLPTGLVDRSRMIITDNGKYNRSVIIAVYGDALCDTTA
jgi:hypothetical protein